MMYLVSNLLLAAITKMFCENACIGNSKPCNHFGWIVWQNKEISLAEQFILVSLRFIAKKFCYRRTTAIK